MMLIGLTFEPIRKRFMNLKTSLVKPVNMRINSMNIFFGTRKRFWKIIWNNICSIIVLPFRPSLLHHFTENFLRREHKWGTNETNVGLQLYPKTPSHSSSLNFETLPSKSAEEFLRHHWDITCWQRLRLYHHVRVQIHVPFLQPYSFFQIFRQGLCMMELWNLVFEVSLLEFEYKQYHQITACQIFSHWNKKFRKAHDLITKKIPYQDLESRTIFKLNDLITDSGSHYQIPKSRTIFKNKQFVTETIAYKDLVRSCSH